jgi:hypothetical protein
MRKNLLLLLFTLSFGITATAQTYNSEWIDFSKTYYKFKLSANGVYRIPQTTLQANGLGAVPAQNFQLFRNGKEVTLYTSVATGTLTATDYIEFWGQMNDGKPDKELYQNAAYQLSDKWSLETDTAVYFLTVNAATANKRYLTTNNNVAGNVLPAEPYFIHTEGVHFRDQINPGFAAVVGENLHSSAYDKGEGWSSGDIYASQNVTSTLTNLFPAVGAPVSATYTLGASGNALFDRTIGVTINGNPTMNQVMSYFDYFKGSVTVPLTNIATGTANIIVTNNASNGNDRMVVMLNELTYPRLFNFGGASNFEFSLPAAAAGNYLDITGFNSGSATPVLYDVTNLKRYTAVVVGAQLRFALNGSATARNLVLVSQAASNISSISSLTSRTFANPMLAANQGDYLMITSKRLHNPADANNAVVKYKNYRASLAGGGYNVRVQDAEDLYDLYAFGIKQHPSSIRNYLRQARAQFTAIPKFVLIIGRGTAYNEARMNENEPYQAVLNMVPTFGYPASDILLSADPGLSVQTIPIGRIGAINLAEVDSYLNKVKEYELAQTDNVFTVNNKAWMKNNTFVAGSSEPFLQDIIDDYMKQYMKLVRDTFTGGATYLFTKTQAGGVVPLSNSYMDYLWNTGHSMLTYFGHSSATTLEFNLDDPNSYSNFGKYPMMMVNGCNSGNYYIYNPFRLTTNNNSTLSEKFVFANQRGSIGFIASTHFGVVNYLHYYTLNFYKALTTYSYGKSIGQIMKDAVVGMFNLTGPNDFYARMHAEEICLQGDPAIKINEAYNKPDYVIEDPMVKISPNFISVAENTFNVEMRYMNLGKAIKDSIAVEVKRQYPAGNTEVVYRKKVSAAYYADSMTLAFNIQPIRDKGLNRITIKIEADNLINEMSETNNTVTKEFFIYEDEARPVFPYNYSIVGQQPQKLFASTANAIATSRTYNMEMDTTELFNSPAKITRSVTQTGGLLEFDPGTLTNNTVYYWRVSPAPSGTAVPNWNQSSFVYINGSLAGYNQSHFYQHLKSGYDRIKLDSASRKYQYKSIFENLFIRNGVWPIGAYEEAMVTVSVNQDPLIRSFCPQDGFDGIAINVIDPVNGKPWKNVTTAGVGMFNSGPSDCAPGREYNFEFSYTNRTRRNAAMTMLDNLPNGVFVVIRNLTFIWSDPSWFVDTWKNDAVLNGNGRSLYNTLKANGLNLIDSFNTHRAFGFIYRKGGGFTPKQQVTDGITDRISLSADITLPDTLGYITSPVFGPARQWKEVHWRGNTLDAGPGDVPIVSVIGITPAGAETTLYNLNATQQDFDISTVNPIQYPYMRLKMKNQDSVNGTPYQLQYWRLNYVPIPEGAVAPNITLQIKDTVDAGEPMQVKLAFKNISSVAFDSLKVVMKLTDRNNQDHLFTLPKQKPIVSGEVLTIDYTIPTTPYQGLNTLYVDVNPDNHQPEQFHFNNFLYKNFYVKPDTYNPLLDVTFDGVHILDRDIVSSRPNILIKLKDESRFLALDDTSLVSVKLKYPNTLPGVYRTFNWDGDTLKFNPANLSSGENSATIDFKPWLLEDGDYELVVKGRDRSGNNAGTLEYSVTFKVVNKPMISNMLNFPNPFTTSTAFVFTLTGQEVPQNLKIQILTVTGKIVREITKQELGTLRIGRNITEFKWDGTDQYGSKLANGVYLYRVVTNLNGKSLDHYKVGKDDRTDQYFDKGYGKMVLIR